MTRLIFLAALPVIALRSLACIVCVVGAAANLPGQTHVELLLRSKDIITTQTPAVVQQPKSGTIFVGIAGRGIYRIDTATWTLRKIPEVQGTAAYQSHYVSAGSSFALIAQQGFSGSRSWRIDSNDRFTLIESPIGSSTAFDSTIDCDRIILSSDRDDRVICYSYDCGANFTCDTTIARIRQPTAGASVVEDRNRNLFMICPGKERRKFDLRLRSDQFSSEPVLARVGTDSVLAVLSGNGKPDTVCFASLHDGIWVRKSTLVSIDGVDTAIPVKSVFIRDNYEGDVLLFRDDPSNGSTSYARYDSGRWRSIGTIPIRYIRGSITEPFGSRGSRRARLQYSSAQKRFFVVRFNPYSPFGWDIPDSSNMLRASPQVDAFSSRWLAYYQGDNVILFSDTHEHMTLNAMAANDDEHKTLPVLLGFTDSTGNPLYLDLGDDLIAPDARMVGRVRSVRLRDAPQRSVTYPSFLAPLDYTVNGMRMPFVGEHEVLFPGSIVQKLDRNGRMTAVIHDSPSTAVARISDSSIVVAGANNVVVYRSNGSRDSMNVLALLDTAGALKRGFVSWIQPLPSGRILCFVSGLRLRDADDQTHTVLSPGGVLYSDDSARTWKRAAYPAEQQYMLGVVRRSTGELFLSATSVVRDTTGMDSNTPESLTHEMDDHVVLRSTDDGATWQTVHTSNTSASFRFVGFSGLETSEGAMLLVSPDGAVESLDGGATWNSHDIQADLSGTRITSFFTHGTSPEHPVYYCTNNGLYRSTRSTSVSSSNARTSPMSACSWDCHQTQWTAMNARILRMTDAVGKTYQTSYAPTTGVYVVELQTDTGIVRQTIVVAED